MKLNKKRDRLRPNGYTIPQKEFSSAGIKDVKDNFRPSIAATPFFGSNVKDSFSVNDISDNVELDVRKNYDFAREHKAISRQELIEKYGTEYPEFQTITADVRRSVYGDDITINNKPSRNEEKIVEKKEEKVPFDFVKTADEVVGDNKKNSSELESFNFNQFKTEEKESEPSVDDDLSFGSFKPKYQNIPDNREAHTTIIRNNSNTQFKPREEINYNNNDNAMEYKAPITNSQSQFKTYEELNRGHSGMVEPVRTEPNKTYGFDGPAPSFEHKPNYMPGQAPSMTANKDFSNFKAPLAVDPYRDYKLPPRDMFKRGPASSGEEPEWLFTKRDIIDQTLVDFGIDGKVIKWTKGPTFSRYEVALEPGVSVRKVNSIYDNLQMNLGAKTLRIQAPIPGKTTVGIEVPNDKTDTVYFGDIINDEFYAGDDPLKVALGKDIDNNSIYTRIDKWPHGLIAGSTGSGKSVCMNTILISILLRNKPDEVKLLLVDPKTVELVAYNDLPHLVTPVINDPQLASEGLKWACEEMDRRYAVLAQNKVRNIKDYNEKCKIDKSLQKMCYIVVIIDELADLMITCSNEIEDSIKRITAKARAAGIHLLVATQRPTVDVIKGTIKANISTRVAFHTVSQIDSQTILEEGGAENLLGKGDMLLKEGDIPSRLQGAYIPDSEIDAVTNFIRAEAEPDYLFSHEDLKKKMASDNAGAPGSTSESPEVLYNVALFCIEQNMCSINSIQQQFQFGFNRANKIVQALEQLGVVSGKNGTKGREVLCQVSDLERIFNGE